MRHFGESGSCMVGSCVTSFAFRGLVFSCQHTASIQRKRSRGTTKNSLTDDYDTPIMRISSAAVLCVLNSGYIMANNSILDRVLSAGALRLCSGNSFN